jgi:hypothetical protein
MRDRICAGLARRAAWAAGALLGLFALSAAAQAQAVRFIRTNGNDANACTLTQPCRTFLRGVQATPVRGELRLLDSGPFGNGVTIAKSITVTGNDNTLILTGPIVINHPAAKVAFRDLLLTGLGTTPTGIVVTAAATVHIVGCEIERFAFDGVQVNSADATEIFVSDTISRNNGEDGMDIRGEAVRAAVDKSLFENNGSDGLRLDEGAQGIVARSTFSGNGDDGFILFGGVASIANSIASRNQIGFTISGGEAQIVSSVARDNVASGIFNAGTLSLSKTTVSNNNVGIDNSFVLHTRQNNRVFGNDDDFDGDGATAALGGT